MSNHTAVRYEPEDRPPHALSAGLGAQIVVLILTGIMITPLIIGRAAGLDAASMSWLVFAALVAAGLSTWLQCVRVGVIGSGYVMFVGSNIAFASVCVAALGVGGLPLMAALAACSALFTFAFTARLGALRRILTPAVGGTVLILMAFSIAPVVWGMFKKVPTTFVGTPAVPLVLLATLVPILLVMLFGKGFVRLWAPLLGVVVGSAVAGSMGMIDTAAVSAAPWIGLPAIGWPGLSFEPLSEFAALLPGFVLISLVGCIETYADSVAVQRSSHRQSRPIDFRAVQGAINADGAGSFVAGLLGTVPNTVYSMSVGVMELTGVAARRVGWWGGLFLVLLAFSPKLGALVGAMPSPVAAGYLLMVLVLMFGHGLRMINEESLGFEEGVAVCLGFWVGVGFQGGFLFNSLLPPSMQLFLGNATTSGGLTAMLLMGLLSLRKRSRDQMTVLLDARAVRDLRPLVAGFCKRIGWDDRAEQRLMLAAEEALLFLLENQLATDDKVDRPRLQVKVREVEGLAEVELVCAPAHVNVQSLIGRMPAEVDPAAEDDIALRLLRAMTRSVRHMQYHGTDYLLITVDSAG